MFFYISKLFYFLLTPIVWFVIAFAFAIYTKNKSLRKKVILFSCIGLYVFSNQFIANETIRQWEVQTIHIDSIKKPYDYGIVLGGFNTYDVKFDRVNFNKASDRLWQTLLLYKQGKIKKILISGGEGRIIKENYSESEITKEFLIKIGIPEGDILIEPNSRNTYENAIETAKIVKHQHTNQTYIIITSAIHMKRAQACFKKAGINCDTFSTDRIAGKTKFLFDYCFIPDLKALENWRVLIREIVGYISYSIVGYI